MKSKKQSKIIWAAIFIFFSIVIGYKISSNNYAEKSGFTTNVNKDISSKSTSNKYLLYGLNPDSETFVKFHSEYGYSFLYPEIWGKASEKLIDNDKEKNGYTGKSYRLSFTDIDSNKMFAVGHSVDYGAARMALDTDYNGDPNEPSGVTSDFSFNYKIFNNDDVKNRYYVPYPYYVRVSFNLPGRKISGVRLFIKLLSDEGVGRFITQYDHSNYGKPSEECLNTGLDCEEVKRNIEEMLKIMEENGLLDRESVYFLNIFQKMVDSSEILK